MSTSEIFNCRLTRIGCERLPFGVVKTLRENVERSIAKAVERIVEREVTTSKIAKIFVRDVDNRNARTKGGFKGEIADVPFDQSDPFILPPQNETETVTGTTTHNPDQP